MSNQTASRPAIPRPQALALAWLLAGTLAARGQEALRSALSIDELIASKPAGPVDLSPAGHYWGPVRMTLNPRVALFYDDNVNLSQTHPRSDLLSSIGVDAGVLWLITDRSALRFETGLSYLEYWRHTRNGGFEITPDSGLSYAFSMREVTITVFDQIKYSERPGQEAALANVTTLSRLDNTAGVRFAWEPGQWAVQSGYSHNLYFSGNDAYAYLNRSSEYFFARAGWRFAKNTEAGVEASGSLTAYDLATQNDNFGATVGPYGEWQVIKSLRLTLRGGPSVTVYDRHGLPGGGSTLNSYYAGFQAVHQAADFLTQRLSVNREVQPGLNQDSAYVEQLSVGYSVSVAVTPWINLLAGIGYETGNQPLPLFLPGGFRAEVVENFDVWRYGPEVSWQMTSRVKGSVAYAHSARESNLAGRAYRDNTVSITLSYAY